MSQGNPTHASPLGEGDRRKAVEGACPLRTVGENTISPPVIAFGDATPLINAGGKIRQREAEGFDLPNDVFI